LIPISPRLRALLVASVNAETAAALDARAERIGDLLDAERILNIRFDLTCFH
jgi:hypothetical protein